MPTNPELQYTTKPFERFKTAVREQITPDGSSLLQAGLRVARWYQPEKIAVALEQYPDSFCGETDKEKLQDSIRVHKAIFGRDGNVFWHNVIIGRLCKKLSEASLKSELTLEGYQPYLLEDIEYAGMHNDTRTILANPQDAYEFQVAGYFHDLGECHLEICDVITGQKNQEQKNSEDDIILQILTKAGFEGE